MLRSVTFCENACRRSTTISRSSFEITRGMPIALMRPGSVDKALCLWVRRVHGRIEPQVSDEPALDDGEKLQPLLVGKLQLVGQPAHVVAIDDAVRIHHLIFADRFAFLP